MHGQTKLCPDYICSSCCSPTASTSAAVPRLHLLQLAAPQLCPLQLLFPECVHLLPHTRSAKYNKYKGCTSLSLSPPPKLSTSITHTQTHFSSLNIMIHIYISVGYQLMHQDTATAYNYIVLLSAVKQPHWRETLVWVSP